MVRTATLALILSLGLTGITRAGETYQYKFNPGEARKYSVVLKSKGTFTLPDGNVQKMDMQSTSIVSQKALSAADGVYQVEIQTLRSKASLDGETTNPPESAKKPRTIALRADGSVEGDKEGGTFSVPFPARPLSRGDSWDGPAQGDKPEGLPLQVTYTLAEIDQKLPEYENQVDVIKASYKVGNPGADRKIDLKQAEGTFWFDRRNGTLLKSAVKYAYDEEVKMDVADQKGVVSKRSLAFGMSFALVPPKSGQRE